MAISEVMAPLASKGRARPGHSIKRHLRHRH